MAKDFFISYTHSDKDWAEWIAWELEQEGYSIILQAWDFRPGGNFVLDMHRASQLALRTLLVLSPAYFASKFTQPEWAAAFQQDPTGENGKLLPIHVRTCKDQIDGLLGPIGYIDLVGLNMATARQRLLESIQKGRQGPKVPPAFPGP